MCKVISIVNQKGGCSKTTSAVNIGIGLANAGKKVVLIDADAQGSLTASLGFQKPDELKVTLATIMAIEGVFVSDEMQSYGIGKLLLDYIKDKKVSLRLNVYQKNARAISFYQREGFIIQCEDLDEDTGEKEYTMLWKRK